MSFTPPAPAQEHGERIDRLAAGRAAALHMVAHAGDRLAQPPLDAAEGDPKALGNLAVREVAEVSKLDQLPLARWQIADRLADSLAHHRARASSPVGRRGLLISRIDGSQATIASSRSKTPGAWAASGASARRT